MKQLNVIVISNVISLCVAGTQQIQHNAIFTMEKQHMINMRQGYLCFNRPCGFFRGLRFQIMKKWSQNLDNRKLSLFLFMCVFSEFYENSAVMLEEEGAVIVGLLVGLNVIDANLCVKGEDLDTQVWTLYIGHFWLPAVWLLFEKY